MFPWLFLWAPYYAPNTIYPWGGAVRQAFSLDTFFDSIAPNAGDGTVEHAIFDYASYGRQIGTLSDIVAILLSRTGLIPAVTSDNEGLLREKKLIEALKKKAGEIIDQFTKTYEGIETIKSTFSQSRIDTINRILKTLTEDELQYIERAVKSRLSQEQSKRR